MKNIFKTANSKLFLLFLITFLSNLSYGQELTQLFQLPSFSGILISNQSSPSSINSSWDNMYLDNTVVVTEYNEYEEEYANTFGGLNWNIPDPSLHYSQNDFLNSSGIDLDSSTNYVSMEALVAGIMDDFAYYDDPFFNQGSMATGVLSSFINAAFNNTSGQTTFKLTVDQLGNSFVGGTGIDVVNGVYTSSGQYVDYTNNSDLVNQLFKGLSSNQVNYLYDQANYLSYTPNAWLNQVFVNKLTNFDHDQFIEDVRASYLDAQDRYGLTPPPFTIGATGAYGWNDGSAERLWSEYIPFTSSFSTWLNGVKTGDKSQIAWGTFLLVADAASFGEGGFLIKGAEVGALGESAVKAGILGFVEKTLLQKIDDIAKVWSTKFPIQEMLEGRSYFEDIMGQYRYLKSSGWSHTGDISQFFKGVDFYKGTEVLVDGVKTIYAETAVSMKTTITTNVDTWLASAPIQKNIKFLEEGLDLAKGLSSNGTTMKMTKAEIHIYMPKANITPELTTAWMNKLSTVNPNIKFEIKALEDFIH